MELQKKLEKMKEFLSNFSSAVVAFSGGVDSSTLAAVCRDVISNTLAVTVKSEKTPSREIEKALRIAKEIGVKHRFLELNIFNEKGFVENSEMRCYYCKKFILTALTKFAISEGYEVVFEGTNVSDLNGHRPGYKAIIECDMVFSPWVDFGITKEEIRKIAKLMGFSFYSAPSMACLASRIPFGIKIRPEMLKAVDKAENFVIEIANVENLRVRNINGFAVIEVEPNEIPKILAKREKIREYLLRNGFSDVFLNPEGYKSGIIVKEFDKLLSL
ncbi:MAG: ATP-dependent sacrificial sulfur transferase LarE [Archaeoglobaceae archaeon]